jgi:hypothetical protein
LHTLPRALLSDERRIILARKQTLCLPERAMVSLYKVFHVKQFISQIFSLQGGTLFFTFGKVYRSAITWL